MGTIKAQAVCSVCFRTVTSIDGTIARHGHVTTGECRGSGRALKDVPDMTHKELKAECVRLLKERKGEDAWPDRDDWREINSSKAGARRWIEWEFKVRDGLARIEANGGHVYLPTFNALLAPFMGGARWARA